MQQPATRGAQPASRALQPATRAAQPTSKPRSANPSDLQPQSEQRRLPDTLPNTSTSALATRREGGEAVPAVRARERGTGPAPARGGWNRAAGRRPCHQHHSDQCPPTPHRHTTPAPHGAPALSCPKLTPGRRRCAGGYRPAAAALKGAGVERLLGQYSGAEEDEQEALSVCEREREREKDARAPVRGARVRGASSSSRRV